VAATNREEEWTELMRAALEGDSAAYNRLLTILAPALRSMARRGLERAGRGDAEVEDVVQETLLAIHLKRGTWDRTRSAGPWITAIARYKLVDCLRRRGAGRYVQIDDLAESLGDHPAGDDADRQDVTRMLGELEGRSLEVVQAVAIEGNSAREAAERLGMTEGAVRVSLHRSLKRLAARYRSRN